MSGPTFYVDGAPCANVSRGCAGTYRRANHTGRGLCYSCYHDGRFQPPADYTEPCRCGCGAPVKQYPRRRLYASPRCCAKVNNASRAKKKTPEYRATRVERKPAMKYIHEERMAVNARGLAHLCMYCEANPVKTPGGDICTDRECLTQWNSDYARGRREVGRAARESRESIRARCACPCNRQFTTRNPSRKWFSAKCRDKAKREKVTPVTPRRGPAILFGRGRRFLGREYAAA